MPEAQSIFAVRRTARKSTIDASYLKGNEYQGEYTEKEARNFLSNDLPEYLWNIRKTSWVVKAL
ncbi:hypothetical protein IKI14_03985 [bacterium]|nr:hypothetical protein [bacterium]